MLMTLQEILMYKWGLYHYRPDIITPMLAITTVLAKTIRGLIVLSNRLVEPIH